MKLIPAVCKCHGVSQENDGGEPEVDDDAAAAGASGADDGADAVDNVRACVCA